MRLIITLMLVLSISASALAQGNVDFTLQVFNLKRQTLSQLEVVAVERYSRATVTGVTNSSGKVKMNLQDGKKWDISVGKIANCMVVTSFENSDLVASQMYIYDLDDYKRKQKQVFDRDNSTFKQITQNANAQSNFGKGTCMLRVFVKLPKSAQPVPNISVDVVNLKDSLIYKGVTDAQGYAYFIVPNRTEYDIDIDGLKNVRYVDFGREVTRYTCSVRFVPTNVNERISNDTIYQDIARNQIPTSTRALVNVNVEGGPNDGIGEAIFFRNIKTGKVYTATTDKYKEATLLLPLQEIFLIDFTYQSDVDALNLQKGSDFVTCNVSYYYRPDPRRLNPENFLPTTDNLLLTSYDEFLEKQYPCSNDKPFVLKFIPMKKINKDSKEALYMLTLAGSKEYTKNAKRIPLNISLVLDKSGSMYSNNRNESLMNSLDAIEKKLIPGDQISIVFFDTEANLIMSTNTDFHQEINRVKVLYEPIGGTNIYKGMQIGTQEVLKHYDPKKTNRVFVLTDGYGTTEPQTILNYVESNYSKGVEYCTIGMGYGYNQALLELIAKKGQGQALFLQSEHLSNQMAEQLQRSILYNAKDVEVEIYYNNEMIFKKLIGFPTTEQKSGQVNFNIPYISANTNELAFLKFKLEKANAAIEKQPLVVKVRYWDMVLEKQIEYTEKVALEWTEESDLEMLIDKEEKRLYGIAIMNQSLKLMADANMANDYQASKFALQACQRQMEELFPEAKPKHIEHLLRDVENYLSLIKNIEAKGLQAY